MGRRRNMKIRPEALKAELFRRGLDTKEASVEIGATPYYLNECLRRGSINRQSIVALHKLYNITPERYLEVEECSPVPPDPAAVDYDRIEEIVRKVVEDAIREHLHRDP